MAEHDADKSQEPTLHRRQKAREQGHVAKSQDLGSAVLLLLALGCLIALGGGLVNFLGAYCQQQLSGEAWLSADVGFVLRQWKLTLNALAGQLLPILGLLLLGAVGVNVVQIGFLFLPQKLAPDISRLDPIKGAQRLFSLSNVVRLAFGIFKILVIATVAFASLYHERDTILGLADREVPQIAAYLFHVLFWTAAKIAVALLVLALLDYGFQRWRFEKDLRMTPQEVREEMKHLEGNPEITARRRQVQRQLALHRLSAAVPKADVVITNPTELAVAIQYEPETMAAPIVVAKGAGVIALRIRQLALQHGIPVVEKKPLAQALYREVDIDHPIPKDKYAAVAEVLAYVYQLQGKTISSHTANAA
jgi:flagellar biosynthetic protein FlhB